MLSRKSLFVALTVLMMLAMMVPVAFAAPEWTHGIAIDSPTTADPAKTQPGTVDVEYTLDIVGTQVHDVHVKFWLVNAYDAERLVGSENIQSSDLNTGANAETAEIDVPGDLDEGWYDLKACAQDMDEVLGPQGPEFCTTQAMAVLLDYTAPWVKLTKPSEWMNPWAMGLSFVTGQKFELLGQATDNFEVVAAWFEYSAFPNFDDTRQDRQRKRCR